MGSYSVSTVHIYGVSCYPKQVNVLRSVESHSRARENIFIGPFLELFLKFYLLKWRILVYFIFLGDGGAPKTSRGPE